MSLLELPEGAQELPERTADWIELCTLVAPYGEISIEQMQEVAGDIAGGGEDVGIDANPVERLLEDAWSHLSRRKQLLGDRGYPFDLEVGLIRQRDASWESWPAYLFLLILDVGRWYSGVRDKVLPKRGPTHQHLFESVVQASFAGIFKGNPSVRFGWPIEAGWPTAIEDRVRHLASLLDLDCEDLTGKLQPADKDRTLDVVVRAVHTDPERGGLFLLAQCATGRNWTTKNADPVVPKWNDLIRWRAPLQRAVALPWRLGGPGDWSYYKTFTHFGAIVFDRPRLLNGAPDRHLDERNADRLRRWSRAALKLLPAVD